MSKGKKRYEVQKDNWNKKWDEVYYQNHPENQGFKWFQF